MRAKGAGNLEVVVEDEAGGDGFQAGGGEAGGTGGDVQVGGAVVIHADADGKVEGRPEQIGKANC